MANFNVDDDGWYGDVGSGRTMGLEEEDGGA